MASHKSFLCKRCRTIFGTSSERDICFASHSTGLIQSDNNTPGFLAASAFVTSNREMSSGIENPCNSLELSSSSSSPSASVEHLTPVTLQQSEDVTPEFLPTSAFMQFSGEESSCIEKHSDSLAFPAGCLSQLNVANDQDFAVSQPVGDNVNSAEKLKESCANGSNEVRLSAHIMFIRSLDLLVCLCCQVGFDSGKAAVTHVKDYHARLKKVDEKNILSYEKVAPRRPHRVSATGFYRTVPYLRVVTDAFCCDQCWYCSTTAQSMRTHLSRTKHNSYTSGVAVQTLCRQRDFFPVHREDSEEAGLKRPETDGSGDELRAFLSGFYESGTSSSLQSISVKSWNRLLHLEERLDELRFYSANPCDERWCTPSVVRLVNEYFSRIQDQVLKVPFLARQLLQQSDLVSEDSEESLISRSGFKPLQETSSIKKYTKYALELLHYLFACDNENRFGDEYLLREAISAFHDEKTITNLHKILAAFVMHEYSLKVNMESVPVFRFMVISNCLVDGVLRPARLITPKLSMLIYLFRGVVLLDYYQLGDTADLKHAVRFLRETTFCPFSIVAQERALLYCIASEENLGAAVQWLDQEKSTLSVEGVQLSTYVLSCYVKNLQKSCERLISDLCAGYCTKDMFYSIEELKEDLADTKQGNSFVLMNRDYTMRTASAFLGYMCQSSEMRKEGHWVEGAISDWFGKFDDFVTLLLCLVHISGGMPARGTELSAYTWKNSESFSRSVYLYGKHVMLVQINDEAEFASEYVWVNSIGVLSAEQCRAAFCAPLKDICGVDLNFNSYRQAVQALAESHLHLPRDQDVSVVNEQFGHSSKTGYAYYGRSQFEVVGVSRDSVAKYYSVSLAWHQLLGYTNGVQPSEKPAGRLGKSDKVTLSQNINVFQTNLIMPSKTITYDVETSMHQVHDSTGGYTKLYSKALHYVKKLGFTSFKSTRQAELAISILANEQDILGVLPTGGGKTLAVVLPLLSELGGTNNTSVLVAPLVGLRDQIVRLVHSFNISCEIWNSNYSTEATSSPRLLVVAVENACTRDFLGYLGDMNNLGRVARVVIDECHMISSSSSFRSSFRKLATVRVGSFPLVLLSATVPPNMEKELSITFAAQLKVVRMQTVNWHQYYSVTRVDSDKLLPAAVRIVKDKLRVGRCAVVFVKSKSDTNLLSTKFCQMGFRAACYSSDLSGQEREALCRQVGIQINVLVATSAFSVGIDLKPIDLVIHYNCAWSLLDYIQECGRAGRDGQASYCFLLATSGLTSGTGDEIMNAYIKNSTVCRRSLISGYVDTDAAYCPQNSQSLFCDVCSLDFSEEPAAKKLRFAAYPVTQSKEISSDGLSMKEVRKSPTGVEILRAVSELGKLEAVQKIKAPKAQTASRVFIQHRFAEEYKNLEGIIKLLRFVKEQGCMVCLLSADVGQKHSLGQCPRMKNVCIHCYGPKHSEACSRLKVVKLCFRCAMPGNLGPLFKHGDCFGMKCQQGLDDLLVPTAMTIWRCTERREALLKDLVTGVQFHNVNDYSGYWKWLCQRGDLDLPNFVYVLKYAVDNKWI